MKEKIKNITSKFKNLIHQIFDTAKNKFSKSKTHIQPEQTTEQLIVKRLQLKSLFTKQYWSKFFRRLKDQVPKDTESLQALGLKFLEQFKNQQKITRYGKLLTILICTYFLADVVIILIEDKLPEPPQSPRVYRETFEKRQTIGDYQTIFTRNLFNSKGLIPGDDTVPNRDAPAIRTTLPLNLIGTLILEDELRSLATIEDKTASSVYPVRVDDEIPSKVKILKVEARKVTFTNLSSGRKEFIDLPDDIDGKNPTLTLSTPSKGQKAVIEQTSPNRFAVPRTEVDAALGDLNNILTQARAVPNWENGVFTGYKLFQIVPGSIYDKLGLKNGDLLLGIDGESVSDPGKAFEMLSKLKDKNHLEIKVKRNGRDTSMAYDIN